MSGYLQKPGSGGGGGTWGSITGTLSNQTDLQSALDLKVPTTRTLTINGTAYDLSADRTWSVGTVTSVAALTLGTTGTDLSSSVATGTTTPVITLNVPTASATNRGALSSTDWSTFNAKESALTFSTGLTRTSNTITANLSTGIAGGQSVIGGTASGNNLTLSSTSNATKGKILFGTNSAYDEVNIRLGIGTTTPTARLHIEKNTNSGIEYPNILIKNLNTSGDSFSAIDLQASNGNVWSQLLASGSNTVFGAPGVGFRVITANPFFIQTSNVTRMTVSVGGNVGIGTLTPTARLHLPAGTATASTAPLKFTSGTNLTVAEAGAMEYNNTFHLTNSDATRRHIATAPNTTKVTAGAPYTNDGYIIINIGGTDFKVMTTA